MLTTLKIILLIIIFLLFDLYYHSIKVLNNHQNYINFIKLKTQQYFLPIISKNYNLRKTEIDCIVNR